MKTIDNNPSKPEKISLDKRLAALSFANQSSHSSLFEYTLLNVENFYTAISDITGDSSAKEYYKNELAKKSGDEDHTRLLIPVIKDYMDQYRISDDYTEYTTSNSIRTLYNLVIYPFTLLENVNLENVLHSNK